MFKNLNLPNKLTVIRMILVPIFIALMAMSNIENLRWISFIALGVYILASITDFVDGKIARSKNLVTDFGKVMDPLADKMLVASGFIMLSYFGVIPGWIVAIIVARDFYVDSLRMLAIMKNKVVPASFVGKIKTFFEMVTIVLLIVNFAITKNANIFDFVNKGFSMPLFVLFVNIFAAVCTLGTFIVTLVSIFTYTFSFSKILSENESQTDEYEGAEQIDILDKLDSSAKEDTENNEKEEDKEIEVEEIANNDETTAKENEEESSKKTDAENAVKEKVEEKAEEEKAE